MSKKGGGNAPNTPRWENIAWEELQANRLNEHNPFGSAVYQYNPETKRRERVTKFSPQVQSMWDKQFAGMSKAYDKVNMMPVNAKSVQKGLFDRNRYKNNALARLLDSASERWNV